MVSVGRADELRRNPEPVAFPAYASLHYPTAVEAISDDPHVLVVSFEDSGGGSRHDLQRRDSGQVIQNLFRKTCGEVFVFIPAAEIQERKHRNRAEFW